MQSATSSHSNASPTLPPPHTQQQSSVSASDALHRRHRQQLAKLDGVLYHFYSTTANVIVQSRLTSYRRSHRQAHEQTQLKARLTKWFALQIPELDLFKDELRLWRSISSMLQLDRDSRTSAAADAASSIAVPPLIIDIVLDLSGVPDHHIVQLWKKSGTHRPPHFLSSNGSAAPPAWEDQVPIDGHDSVGSSATAASAEERQRPRRTTQLVVLERWKLQFVPGTPDQVPELPTLYKRSITHFRGLFTLVNALPVGRLCGRIENAQRRAEAISATEAKRDTATSIDPALEPAILDGIGELDHELKIGCRLSMMEHEEGADSQEAHGEVGIEDVLQAEASLGRDAPTARGEQTPRDSGGGGGSSSEETTSVRRFAPIVTPLGTLHTSVTFRRQVDFSVQDVKSLESIREMQIEMDEDFFRPTVEAVRKRTESGASGVRPDMSNGSGGGGSGSSDRRSGTTGSAIESDGETGRLPKQHSTLRPVVVGTSGDDSLTKAAPASSNSSSDNNKNVVAPQGASGIGSQPRPQSLLSATAHQRVGGLPSGKVSDTATAPNYPAGSMGPPTSAPSLTAASPGAMSGEQLLSRSPAGNASVFSSSAPGRPIAGLSSLRRIGSITSNVSNLGSSGITGAVPSSPALAAALSAEPAFLAIGQPRRPSTSERRLHSISSTSSGRDSPTSSVTGTSVPAPAHANSGGGIPASTSLRSSLSRVTSGPIPVASPHIRFGSFSPSSPSPLVQQLSQHRPQHVGPSSASAASAVGSRVSSSPALRSQMGPGAGVGAAVPSLRSVFQTYAPSPSSSLAHVSSPSTLSLRGSISRRSIGPGDTASISALGPSSSGARPQMIQRYSTNFGYRQTDRGARSAYGSSLGMAGAAAEAGLDATVAEPSSLPRSAGGGGSLGSNHGRSWAARMEQRQQYSTFVRSSNSNDDATSGSASTSIRFRSSPAAGVTPTEAYTQSPGSQEGDLDDLMRLIDSKPVLRGSGTGRASNLRDMPEASSSSSAATPGNERGEGESEAPGASGGIEHSGDLPRNAVALSSSSLNGRNTRGGRGGVYASIRGTNPLSRSQVDEMLSRMVQSINVMSPSAGVAAGGVASAAATAAAAAGMERHGAAPGAALQASPTSEDPREPRLGSAAASPGGRIRPSIRAAFDRPASANGMRSVPPRTLTSYRGGASSPIVGDTHNAAADATSSFRTTRLGRDASTFGLVGTGQVRGLRTAADPVTLRGGFDDDATLGYRPGGALGLRRHGSGKDEELASRGGGEPAGGEEIQRAGSGHSLEYDNARHGYDPMDDEAAGRMEMPTGDLFDEEFRVASGPPATVTARYGMREINETMSAAPSSSNTAAGGLHSKRLKSTGQGGGVGGTGGYQVTRTRSGTSRSSPSSNSAPFTAGAALPGAGGGGGGVGTLATMDWERGERERYRERELERRRADAEMARNFGNEVGAGTRGRGSRSPWRHGLTSPSAPSSVTHAVGFGAAINAMRLGQPTSASVAKWTERERSGGSSDHTNADEDDRDSDEGRDDDDVGRYDYEAAGYGQR